MSTPTTGTEETPVPPVDNVEDDIVKAREAATSFVLDSPSTAKLKAKAQPADLAFDVPEPTSTNDEKAEQQEATDLVVEIHKNLENIAASNRPSEVSVPGAFAQPGRSGVVQSLDALQDAESVTDNNAVVPVPTNDVNGSTIVEAFKVEENDNNDRDIEALEAARKQLLSETVQATGVVAEDEKQKDNKGISRAILLFMFLVVVGLIVGLSVGLSSRDDGGDNNEDGAELVITTTSMPTASPTMDTRPTLERVLDRGFLACGVTTSFFTDYPDDPEGFDDHFTVMLCRAISAAVFGDQRQVEFFPSSNEARWNLILNRTVDVTMNYDTHTLDRDVFEAGTQHGFQFSPAYVYSGLTFEGEATFVECLQRRDALFGVCRDLAICVRAWTTNSAKVEELLPGARVVEVPWGVNIRTPLVEGECNVIGHNTISAWEFMLEEAGFTGNYSRDSGVYTKDPLSMITRGNDAQWSDFVNWVIYGLLLAEAQNITQDQADMFVPAVMPFGETDVINFTAAVASGGNFADLYHIDLLDRLGLNALNVDGTTGLLYSLPLGNTDVVGSGPINGGTMEEILERGQLRCGVTPRLGFAEFNETENQWEGFDVEFCRAVSAALLQTTDVEFVSLSIEARFVALANGDVDILAGGPASYVTDVMEPTSGVGFALSMPCFYGEVDLESGIGDVRALLTREDDPQWSDFVFWVVDGLIYAEEEGIDRSEANLMPVIDLFGEGLKQMFRDAVLATGNYDTIYSNTLASLIPRAGRNLLNSNPVGPQQFPLPFGALEEF